MKMSYEEKQLLKNAKYYDARLLKMNNQELLDEFVNVSGGDDYDGGFTIYGDQELKMCRAELEKRLKAIGFL